MSSARLELIMDDALFTPACMSRSMPAALDGLLTQTALDDFCDKLDELLVLSHTESQRVIKRWISEAIASLFLLVFLCIFLFLNMNTLIFFSGMSAYWVFLGIVWLCTQPGANAKSNKEIVQLIRFECDEMTRRTPFVSFHVAAGAMNHIDVSISLSAPASGVITTSNARIDANNSKIDESSSNHQPVVHCAQTITTTTATNDDYQQMNDVV
jgi:hypothetical protein